MSEKIPARFRKTKTEKWAVMAPIEDLEKALAEGGKVDVLKKSGDWSTFQVASLGRPFEVDGVQMCYGYGPGDEADDGSGAQGGQARSGSSGSPRQGQGQSQGRSGDADRGSTSRRPSGPTPDPPPRDDSEPLPEYQGGADDGWGGEF